MRKLLALLFIPLFSACFSSQKVYQSETSETYDTVSQENELLNKIYYCSFVINKDEHTSNIELLEKKEANGNLKEKLSNLKSDNSYLKAVYYNNSEVLAEEKMSHPLYPIIEYNDGEAGISMISKVNDSATFFLRFQFEKPVTGIQFFEKINEHRAETQLNRIDF